MKNGDEAIWFCENRACCWSVILSLSAGEVAWLRCVCGRPLKRVPAPISSPYLEFLRADETSGKGRQAGKE